MADSHRTGKLVDYLDQAGQRENTIIFYIWGDNGSSAEGQNGSISELLAQATRSFYSGSDDACDWFWSPLYASVCHRGYPSVDAQYFAQAFFAHLLEHDTLS